LERGDLTIAISTSGKCPALARRLRQQLEQEIGPEYAPYLELLGETRRIVRQQLAEFNQRRAFYQRLLEGDLLVIFRNEGYQSAQARILEELQRFLREAA
jgi:siroheme synthase-like protein